MTQAPKTNYVAGFLFSPDLRNIALIKKNRPAWQKGKLNGIGGHIEKGETPHEAMSREFCEETCLAIKDWKQFAMLCDKPGEWSVDWFWSRVPQTSNNPLEIYSPSDEQVAWYPVFGVLDSMLSSVYDTIPNLHWLIPMALNDIHGQDSCTMFTIMEAQRRK
jgi:8-oxo-dGTP diphosphatase